MDISLHPVTDSESGKSTGNFIDYKKLNEATCANVDGDSNAIWRGYHGSNAKAESKHLYSGTAKFIGKKVLKIENSYVDPETGEKGQGDKIISADTIFIACGAQPTIPKTDTDIIPGLAKTPYLTSTEALRLKELPKKIIVVGAGYIAVELGYMFAGL